MDPESNTPSLWSMLRKRDAGILPRLIASVASMLVFAAVGFTGAWAYTLMIRRAYVRDDDVGIALACAGVGWIGTLFWIWGGFQRDRRIARATVGTGGTALITTLICVWLDLAVRHNSTEVLIAAVIMVGACVILLLWTPVILHRFVGHPIVSSDNLVNVHCPTCGYSMIGLRSLRCPECGNEYSVDELIRRQDYAALAEAGRHEYAERGSNGDALHK